MTSVTRPDAPPPLHRGSLNRKATAFVVLGVAALAALLYVAVRLVVLSQLDQVEQSQARAHTDDVARVVRTMTEEFAFRGKDWSDWNDMMTFAEAPTAEWEADTFGCSVLTSTGWDLAVVYRGDGKVVHHEACDHVSRAVTPMPAGIEALLNRDILYRGLDTDGPPLAGIVRDGDRLWMLASRAIVRADGSPGAVHARFVYGFEIDDAWYQRIRGFTGLDLAITPGVAAGVSATTAVEAQGDEHLVGSVSLPGLSGLPVATLRVTEHRSLSGYGSEILTTSLIVISIGGVLFAVATLLAMRRGVLRPVRALLSGVRALESGSRARVDVATSDELGVLGAGFNRMADAIVDRETRLADALGEVRLVLDSTGDALVGCALDGKLRGAPSRAALTWFGEPAPGVDVADWIFGADVRGAEGFRLGLDDVVADIMPWELVAAQMPARTTRGAVTFGLAYRRIERDGALQALLIVVTDQTAQIEAERAEREGRELQMVVGNILRDPADFERFLGECEELLGELERVPQLEVQKRVLHTLKGTTAIYGFVGFSEACHRLEDRVADDPANLDASALVELRAAWTQAIARVLRFAPASDAPRVALSVPEYSAFLERIDHGTPHAVLAAEARRWLLQPGERLFSRLAQQSQRLAEQMGKEVDVRIIDHGLRLAAEPLRPLIGSLVHAVRNALDHGLETPDERVAAGKAPRGRIEIELVSAGDRLSVHVRDDGRGIAWDRVRARAAQRGIVASDTALAETLFEDGFSTREEVTALSGRGVGLSAIRDACRALDGDCHIGANPAGAGSVLTCTLSLSQATRVSLSAVASSRSRRPKALAA